MALRGNMQEEPARRSAPTSRSAPDIAAFGPFTLSVPKRVLQKDGVPLKIGSRALDILITLVEGAPDIVGKREILARVWGPLVVDEGSLRFHVAALRKVLGDGKSDALYVTNIPGRGYCFAAPVSWAAATPASGDGAASSTIGSRLPRPPLRMVGRHSVVRDLTKRLREQRFVSIVGAGGSADNGCLGDCSRGPLRIRRCGPVPGPGAVQNPQLVPGALASLLGVPVVSETPLPAILAFFTNAGCCWCWTAARHVIETAAALGGKYISRCAAGAHSCHEPRVAARGRRTRLSPAAARVPPPPIAGP